MNEKAWSWGTRNDEVLAMFAFTHGRGTLTREVENVPKGCWETAGWQSWWISERRQVIH